MPANNDVPSSETSTDEEAAEDVFASLLLEGAQAAAKALQSVQVKAQRLQAQLCDRAEVELWRRRGRVLLQAPEQEWSAGLLSVDLQECVGSSNGTAPEGQVDLGPAAGATASRLAFPLPKPGKSFRENAEACMKQADKMERTNERCGPLIREADSDAARWRAVGESFEQHRQAQYSKEAFEEVCRLRAELCAAGHLKNKPVAPPPGKGADSDLRRKYGKGIDCLRSPSGYEVIVGRTAATNERVSFELTPPDSFWFHSGGVAGSHVAILCPATEVATLEDVEFAAATAAWHSKARTHGVAAVTYCYGGQVTRPLIPKLGQVQIVGMRGTLQVTPALPDLECP